MVFCSLASAASACGPWLPRILLAEDKRQALHPPTAELVSELHQLPALPKLPQGLRAQPFDTQEYEQIREGEVTLNRHEAEDLAAALAYYRAPPVRREKMTTEYLGRPRIDRREPRPAIDPQKDVNSDLEATFRAAVLPPDLPAELAEYLRGAMAFHCGQIDEARIIWEHLLARPAAERRFRSTWAAFMLGRMARWDAATDPARSAEARRWLQSVRTLAQEGCEDGLNLVGMSYYWEAELEPNDHAEEGARLYGLSFAAGCGWSAQALAGIGENILRTEDESVRQHAAQVPLLRQLATASALVDAAGYQEWQDPEEHAKRAKIMTRWLAALDAAGVKEVEEADRVAWMWYDAGNFRTAAAWLEKAPAHATITLWLRGKLALRAGHKAEASEHFAEAAQHFPEPVPAIYPNHNWWWSSNSDGFSFDQSRQLRADLGIAQMARAHFSKALEAFLRSGAWVDAAYVEEQVMTTDEAIAFLRQHPLPTTDRKPSILGTDDADDGAPVDRFHGNLLQAFRYLLARRLAREGRFIEAQEYIPEKLRARLDEYRANLQRGRDHRLPAEKRAEALWQAARIHRYLGMELFGTETAPDWSIYEGEYDEGDIGALRAGTALPDWADAAFNKTRWLPRISRKEIRRNALLHPTPDARFHYRYVAADLAWEAAALRPPDEETARILCIAGGWLKYRDQQSAYRFYLELVGRCGQTALGVEGENRRWFPPVQDEPFEKP